MRVLKDIPTPTSFFPAGSDVTEEDLAGPVSVDDWRRLGHLEPIEPAKPVKAAKESPLPPMATVADG